MLRKRTTSILIAFFMVFTLLPVSSFAATKIHAIPTNVDIILNGTKVTIEAYNIDGNNFFKLRDLATIIDLEVKYNSDTKVIIINTDSDSIIYDNSKYGFEFTLPRSWENYSITTDKWEGTAIGGAQNGAVVESGTRISIRHPKWTAQNPRQDIPIMVFTISQWNKLQNDEFAVGAAPIPPSELGRNSKYVFALPARYNFAFPEGFEEVESILANTPLKAL